MYGICGKAGKDVKGKGGLLGMGEEERKGVRERENRVLEDENEELCVCE